VAVDAPPVKSSASGPKLPIAGGEAETIWRSPVKGVLFNVVEDVVDSTLPADTWDEVLHDADLLGAYTSLGDYDGQEMGDIVAALSRRTGLPPEEVLRFAGEHGYRFLARRHRDIVGRYPTFGALLHNLDAMIHPEVLKLYPHARPPQFDIVEDRTGGGDGPWRVTYRSDRGLCHLADGLMRGAAEGFGQAITVEHISCVHRGDATCILLVSTDGGPGEEPPA
jgi:hypothetical protein